MMKLYHHSTVFLEYNEISLRYVYVPGLHRKQILSSRHFRYHYFVNPHPFINGSVIQGAYNFAWLCRLIYSNIVVTTSNLCRMISVNAYYYLTWTEKTCIIMRHLKIF